MKRQLLTIVFGVGALLGLSSCNVYSFLAGSGSQEGILESALSCLHETPTNYACAIEEYNKLPAGQLKNEKLCKANLSRAGFTLTAFLNTVQQTGGDVLGALANELDPWTAEKEAAAVAGYAACNAYYEGRDTNNTSDKRFGALLYLLGSFVNCSIRMAKTDQFVATSEQNGPADDNNPWDLDAYFSNPSGTTTKCTEADLTANPSKNGTVDATDVDGNGSNIIGMCSFDVVICGQTIFDIASSGVATDLGGAAGSDDIAAIGDAFEDLPPQLQVSFSSAGALTDGSIDGVRSALVSTIRDISSSEVIEQVEQFIERE